MNELNELEIRDQPNGQKSLPPRIEDVQAINLLIKGHKTVLERLEALEKAQEANITTQPEKPLQPAPGEEPETVEGKVAEYRIDNLGDNGWRVHFSVDGFKGSSEAKEWALMMDSLINPPEEKKKK